MIPQAGWLVSADSQETSCENGSPANATDGNPTTWWVTRYCGGAAPMPHWIQINLGAAYDLTAFRYLARQNGCSNGWIKDYEFYVSADGVSWPSQPTAQGRFDYSGVQSGCPGAGQPAAMQIAFPQTTGQYVRLRALSEINGGPWTVVAELNLLGTLSASNPPPAVAQVTVSPTVVVAGGNAQGTVTLSGPAPAGGAVVALGSTDPAAQVPTSVTIPANAFSANFTITTSSVATATPAMISGTYNNAGAQTPLTVNPGSLIPQSGWLVSADSQETSCENGSPANATDGNSNTWWVTQYCGGAAPMPHWIQINLGAAYDLTAFRYLARQNGCSNGWIKDYEFYVSVDGVSWPSQPTAQGTFDYSGAQTGCPGAGHPAAMQITFPQTTGQYVRLRVLSEVNGNPWTVVAELNLLGTLAASSPPPSLTQVTVNPTIVVGGTSAQGTVTLSEPAPIGGVSVALSSGDPSAQVAASVTVPANAFSANFTITTSSVATATTVTISASYNNVGAQASLTVNPGGLISQSGWLVSADSQEATCENGSPANAIDGNSSTWWVTQYCGGAAPMPHWIQINLGAAYDLTAFQYLARQNGCSHGWIKDYEFYVSADGVSWPSQPTAQGTFDYSGVQSGCPGAGQPAAMQIAFPQTTGQYVRLRALSEINGNPWTTVAEINLLGTVSASTPPPSLTQVTVNPTIVIGGSSALGTVTLNEPAPIGGVSVALSSGDPSAQVAASVTVPANAFSANFTITTSSVATATPVLISATYNNIGAQASLTVNPGSLIPQSGWLVSADSQETSCENGPPANAIDGNSNTWWVTQYCGGAAPMPHWIQINLGAAYDLTAFRYLARQNGCSNGWIKDYEFYVSADGVNWPSQPTAIGTFDYSGVQSGCPGAGHPAAMQIAFPQTTGQYVRLRALSEINGNPWTVVAELNLLGTLAASNPPPSLTQVTVNPTIVVGGSSAQGTVTLSAPAPAGGAVVNPREHRPLGSGTD